MVLLLIPCSPLSSQRVAPRSLTPRNWLPCGCRYSTWNQAAVKQ